MSERLSRLYAIVDRATLDARGVGVGEFARELREAGVRLVQYRDKVNGAQEVLRAAREIDAAFARAEVTRVMNDRADLAVLAGWEGVHVGQGDLGVELVRRVREMTELPIVAIGGITLENARGVIDAGADSVAVIGGLFVEGRRVSEVARDFLEILG